MKMKKICMLVLIMVLLVASVYANNKVVSMKFDLYKNNSIVMKNVKLEKGEIVIDWFPKSEYSVDLVNGMDRLMSIQLPIIYDENSDTFKALPADNLYTNKSINQDKIEVIIKVGYIEDTTGYVISYKGRVLYSAILDLCNKNAVCDNSENYLSCWQDCESSSLDGFCYVQHDGICDPDCVRQMREWKDPDCTCGNGVCDGIEDSHYCPEDCGHPKFWGCGT